MMIGTLYVQMKGLHDIHDRQNSQQSPLYTSDRRLFRVLAVEVAFPLVDEVHPVGDIASNLTKDIQCTRGQKTHCVADEPL